MSKVSIHKTIIKEGKLSEVLQITHQIPEFKNPYSLEEYQKRLHNKKCLVLVAYINKQAVGFKVGYEKETYFYSWMGGVLPIFRRYQIATLLAEAQEKWAKEQGYKTIVFKTRNYLKPMLIFALKRDFYIIGIEPRADIRENRIILEKKLYLKDSL